MWINLHEESNKSKIFTEIGKISEFVVTHENR
jgi:hypothetical protein